MADRLEFAEFEREGYERDFQKATTNRLVLEEKRVANQRFMVRLRRQLEDLEMEGNELDRRVRELGQGETAVFQRAGRLLDDGDIEGAMRSYQEFVRLFPQSPRVAKADNILVWLKYKGGGETSRTKAN